MGDTAHVVQERVQSLRAGLDAFNRTGQIDPAFLASDFELHQASSIVDTAGVFHGSAGLGDSLRELQDAFDDLSFEAEEFLEAPQGEVVVLVHVRGRGRGSGMEIDNHIAWVWTFRGNEAIRLTVYEEPVEALEAVGLKA